MTFSYVKLILFMVVFIVAKIGMCHEGSSQAFKTMLLCSNNTQSLQSFLFSVQILEALSLGDKDGCSPPAPLCPPEAEGPSDRTCLILGPIYSNVYTCPYHFPLLRLPCKNSDSDLLSLFFPNSSLFFQLSSGGTAWVYWK